MSQFNKWFEESKLAGLGPPEAAMLARTPTPTEIQQGIGLMSESPVRPAVKVAPSATETGLPAGLRQTVRGEAPAQPVGNVGAETKVAPEATPANEVATGEIAPGQSVNLTNADMQSRAEVLQRVGQDTARRSAIEADPLQAATEAQMTRHNEPAGQASLNQFTHEKDALENYTSNLIDRMGGTQGMDEASLHQIGQTISKPFDSLRGWFKTSIDNLYNEANKVAGNIPLTDLPNTKSLLSDPTFQNTAFAKGQRELVNSIDSQLKHFIEKNNGELSVQNAEQYRQWLNTIWSPDNSRLIRQVQDALDQDVFSHAGSDIYQTSRKLYELRIKTLDDPKGIAKMFEFDPQTPLNRTTPFNKIPNSLLNLDPDQFEHIVGVLKDMPSDLQPEAQAALGEIKSQFLNKILDAGTQTGGTPSKFWKFRDVNKFFKANTAKMPMVFSPEEMEEIKDIQRAGNINGSDTNYPGTAASVSNAIKAGLMSRALTKVSAAAGAAAGGLAGGVFGPTGGAAGSAAGAAAGEGFGVRQAEKAAQKSFGKKLVPLSEIGK
jgi:hypothetical protein